MVAPNESIVHGSKASLNDLPSVAHELGHRLVGELV